MNDGTITLSTRGLRRLALVIVALVVAVALLALAWQQRDRLGIGGILSRGIGDQIDGSTYQGVFLVGGQVYFGKLATHGDEYVLLDDVFYLSTETAQATDQGQLVKRGSEVHGPREPMIIPMREVLFVENLRPDSEVVKAIERFHSGAPGATSAPVTRTPTPPPARSTSTPAASPSR